MTRSIETFTLRLRRTMTTAHGTIDERAITVVTTTDGPVAGSGEAACLPGFGLESQEEATRALRAWVDTGALPNSPAAMAAVATANENLDAARRGCSLAEHLAGHKPPNSVATQAVVGDGDVDATVTAVGSALDRGYGTIKIKVAAREAAVDVARISEVRRVAGDNVDIRLDANRGWDHASALSVLRALGHLGIDYVEEPTANPQEFASIAAATGISTALDESASDHDVVALATTQGGITIVVLKPAVLGGPRSAFELGRSLREREVRVVVSSFMDGSVGLGAAVEVAAALGGSEVHGLGTAELFTDPFPSRLVPVGGHLELETMPPS